jgi:hypothetical protein
MALMLEIGKIQIRIKRRRREEEEEEGGREEEGARCGHIGC